MYIKTVRLQNFQSYIDQTFEFVNGLNVLKGSSFSGKSALIRSLDFCLYGNKFYEDYLRKGAKSCTITFTFDNSLVVERTKGKGINFYKTIENGKEQVYENFGTSVPEPVKKLMGISELVYDFDKSLKLNIVNQFDPLFLFTEPGSVKAKVVGLLSKIHLVDICLRGLNKDLRGVEDKSRDLVETLERLKVEEKSYDKLSKQLENIQLIQQLISKIEELDKKKEEIERLVELKKSIGNNEIVLTKYRKSVDSIDLEGFNLVIESYRDAVELLKTRQTLESSEQKCRSGLDRVEVFKMQKFEGLLGRYGELHSMLSRFTKVDRDLDSSVVEQQDCEVVYRVKLAEYKKSVLDLGVCPVCSTKITEEVLKNHLEEL